MGERRVEAVSLKAKRGVEYGEERFYHSCRFCVDYDGHWAGQDRQVWSYQSYFTNSLDDAIKFYKRAEPPKVVRERLEKCWAVFNIDKYIAKQREYYQQELEF